MTTVLKRTGFLQKCGDFRSVGENVMSDPAKISIRFCALASLVITLFQISFLLVLAPPGQSLSERFLRLNNWDSTHYISIASTGYHIPSGDIKPIDIHEDRANVVFFPGFPLLSRGASLLFGVSVPLALLVVDHCACLSFWFLFFLLLRSYNLRRCYAIMAAGALLAYPATFYLALGYTEALFMVGALAYIYFVDRHRDLPAIAGSFLAGVTRIVGIALSVYPLLQRLSETRGLRYRDLVLSASAFFGMIAFFAFCQSHLDDWAIYFKLEEIGWQTHRNILAVCNPFSYFPRFFFEDTVLSLNRLAVTFTSFLFFIAYRAEKTSRTSASRAGLYGVALILFYIAFTVKADAHMDSMLRYALPSVILLLLAFAQLWQERATKLKRGWSITAAVFFLIQFWLAFRFLKGKWIA